MERTWELSRAKQLKYSRRKPEETQLYRIVYHNRQELEYQWEDRFQSEYGVLRDVVKDTLDSYLNCGILAHGAARVRCPRCNHSVLIAFSCKKRGICPSCQAKRAIIFAEHLHSQILAPIPHRHIVFSIPKRLRIYFRYERKLNSLLLKSAWLSIQGLYRSAIPDSTPAAILCIQTAGESLNFNPHVHGIIADGAFLHDGVFQPLHLSTDALTEVFSHTLMNALKELGHLHDSVIEQILSWQHCGFSAWTGEQISPTDSSARQFIARYIDRGPVANSKIQITDDIITYLTDSALTHEFSATEFLARITPHIPDKWEQTVRYYGFYSARTRGKRRLVQPQSLSVIPELDKRKASKTWVALIKKIYELDPLLCPKCNEFMKIVAFITNHRELEKIISNLNIQPYKTPPPITSPPTIDSSYSPFFDDLQTVAD